MGLVLPEALLLAEPELVVGDEAAPVLALPDTGEVAVEEVPLPVVVVEGLLEFFLFTLALLSADVPGK